MLPLGLQWGLPLAGLLQRAGVGMDPFWSLGGWDCLKDLVQLGDTGTRVHFTVPSWVLSQWAYYQVHRQVWLLPGPWEGSCLITECVPGWAGLALDCG